MFKKVEVIRWYYWLFAFFCVLIVIAYPETTTNLYFIEWWESLEPVYIAAVSLFLLVVSSATVVYLVTAISYRKGHFFFTSSLFKTERIVALVCFILAVLFMFYNHSYSVDMLLSDFPTSVLFTLMFYYGLYC